VVGNELYADDGELLRTFGSHGDALRGLLASERHVVIYFDWASQRIRTLGPVFEALEHARAFAHGPIAQEYKDLRELPESQVPCSPSLI
jgi:hypothetical protein